MARQECAGLGLRFHLERWVHLSFYQRNILRKPGPLSTHPDKRVANTKKRGGYDVDWSYRLVDFGRSAYVDKMTTDYVQAESQYQEHKNVLSWAAGKKGLDRKILKLKFPWLNVGSSRNCQFLCKQYRI